MRAAELAPEERAIVELFADDAGRLLDDVPLRNRVNTLEFYENWSVASDEKNGTGRQQHRDHRQLHVSRAVVAA